MLVRVTVDSVEVLEPEVLTALSVRAEIAEVDAFVALSQDGLGIRFEPGLVWLDVAGLARRAAVDQDAGWPERYAAMIGYAASQGWTADGDSIVRAHLEVAS
ncbi:hypothetical protein GCM10023350_42410 [Nocardioides endophyticus]|uniref:DUF2442 domain-containing protein n=1 Tax=Nocardioides endophyticus TaxID=1353775 RepID=A0ABP8ZC27_9ACTN